MPRAKHVKVDYVEMWREAIQSCYANAAGDQMYDITKPGGVAEKINRLSQQTSGDAFFESPVQQRNKLLVQATEHVISSVQYASIALSWCPDADEFLNLFVNPDLAKVETVDAQEKQVSLSAHLCAMSDLMKAGFEIYSRFNEFPWQNSWIAGLSIESKNIRDKAKEKLQQGIELLSHIVDGSIPEDKVSDFAKKIARRVLPMKAFPEVEQQLMQLSQNPTESADLAPQLKAKLVDIVDRYTAWSQDGTDVHAKNVFEKLGVSDRESFVGLARRVVEIAPEESANSAMRALAYLSDDVAERATYRDKLSELNAKSHSGVTIQPYAPLLLTAG